MIVSAARYRLLEHNMKELVAQLRADLAAQEDATAHAMRLHEQERRRYDELLKQFMAMKVKGGEVVPVAGGIVEPAPPLPADPLAHLKAIIAEKSGKNYALRGVMLRQLTADVAAGHGHDKIEEAILRGVPSEGVPA